MEQSYARHGGKSPLRSLIRSTAASLESRVDEWGYAPTSLSGAYSGMFTRDASIQAIAMLAIGRTDLARRILDYTDLFADDRVAHVCPPPRVVSARPGDIQPWVDPSTFLEVAGVKAVAAQSFRTGAGPSPRRILVALSGNLRAGMAIARLHRDGASIPLAAPLTAASTTGWLALELPESLILEPEAEYRLELRTEGALGEVRWGASRTPGATDRPAEQLRLNLGGWVTTGVHASLTLDEEPAALAPGTALSALSTTGAVRTVQPDADAMNALAHARTAALDGREIDGVIRRLLAAVDDRDDATGLIINPNLEHSRRSHYLTTIDLVTNVFASQAFHELSALASRPDLRRAAREQADALAAAIHEHLVVDAGFGSTYVELLWLPLGRRRIDGFSWVSLAPVAAGWFATDDGILRRTVERYRRVASSDWDGLEMLNVQDDDDSVIGKGLAWEIAYLRTTGDHERLERIARFLVDRSPGSQFAEQYNRTGTNDLGNQEHASWFVWATADHDHP
ncbi:hypothetical protein [Antiquaquibacter soli]|uniref:Glycogen debranching protein n=1 Tax=Antiquaquibacter soli TaxID=3064523 RepID=A0ABT9BNV2_9MICO|nr:hypothetical protein [Protaetiibacter sp. WY-16]MDO7882709.1 hypothetical protein [Protaetiibacter sp. WY-16]